MAHSLTGSANDVCAEAIAIDLGQTPYDMYGSNKDDLGDTCIDAGAPNIWFDYTADFTGHLGISACDTDGDGVNALEVWEGCACPPSIDDLLACNFYTGADPVCVTVSADVRFAVSAGQCYKIRLTTLSQGQTGTIKISEITPPCPPDTDDNGTVDVVDLVNVILDWSTDGSANGGDVDGSGTVDVTDLVEVVLAWGPCE